MRGVALLLMPTGDRVLVILSLPHLGHRPWSGHIGEGSARMILEVIE